jgi:hypothetical protein
MVFGLNVWGRSPAIGFHQTETMGNFELIDEKHISAPNGEGEFWLIQYLKDLGDR